MRTTLNIDDDVLRAAKELARREGRTAGAILSDLARHGLTSSGGKRKRPAIRGGVPLLPSRGEIITLEHIERIRDDESV